MIYGILYDYEYDENDDVNNNGDGGDDDNDTILLSRVARALVPTWRRHLIVAAIDEGCLSPWWGPAAEDLQEEEIQAGGVSEGPVEEDREGRGGCGDDEGSAGSSGLGHRGAIESMDR